MTNHAKPILLATLLLPTIAFAQINEGDMAGTDEAQILAFLEADGYTIQDVEAEGDELEVAAMLDGQLFEIEVDLTTGLIAEVELEDDEDDDDDEDADDESDDA